MVYKYKPKGKPRSLDDVWYIWNEPLWFASILFMEDVAELSTPSKLKTTRAALSNGRLWLVSILFIEDVGGFVHTVQAEDDESRFIKRTFVARVYPLHRGRRRGCPHRLS